VAHTGSIGLDRTLAGPNAKAAVAGGPGCLLGCGKQAARGIKGRLRRQSCVASGPGMQHGALWRRSKWARHVARWPAGTPAMGEEGKRGGARQRAGRLKEQRRVAWSRWWVAAHYVSTEREQK
jgi:hypothetical protein